MCQKASGQPFMAFATFDARDVQWLRGTPAVFRSSNLAERAFCRDCGTPLYFRFEGDEISVTIGSLDHPRSVHPTTQFGVESAIDWCQNLANLRPVRTEDDLGPELVARMRSHQFPDQGKR